MIKNFLLFLLIFFVAWHLIKAIIRLANLLFSKAKDGDSSNSIFGKKNNITINYTSEKKKHFSDEDKGEYVDYEEIK